MLDRVPHPQETISDGQITLNEACRKDHSPQEPAIVRDPRSRRRPAGGLDVPHPLAMSGQDRNARNHLLRIALPAGKGTSEWAGGEFTALSQLLFWLPVFLGVGVRRRNLLATARWR
jgi:hypothetical protein